MSITDKSAEADFFCGIFAAIYTFYPENLHISETFGRHSFIIKHVREAYTIFRGERFLFIMCYTGKMEENVIIVRS